MSAASHPLPPTHARDDGGCSWTAPYPNRSTWTRYCLPQAHSSTLRDGIVPHQDESQLASPYLLRLPKQRFSLWTPCAIHRRRRGRHLPRVRQHRRRGSRRQRGASPAAAGVFCSRVAVGSLQRPRRPPMPRPVVDGAIADIPPPLPRFPVVVAPSVTTLFRQNLPHLHAHSMPLILPSSQPQTSLPSSWSVVDSGLAAPDAAAAVGAAAAAHRPRSIVVSCEPVLKGTIHRLRGPRRYRHYRCHRCRDPRV